MILDKIQIQLESFNNCLQTQKQLLCVFNNSQINLSQFKETIIISNKMDSLNLLILLLRIIVNYLAKTLRLDVLDVTGNLVEELVIKMNFG